MALDGLVMGNLMFTRHQALGWIERPPPPPLTVWPGRLFDQVIGKGLVTALVAGTVVATVDSGIVPVGVSPGAGTGFGGLDSNRLSADMLFKYLLAAGHPAGPQTANRFLGIAQGTVDHLALNVDITTTHPSVATGTGAILAGAVVAAAATIRTDIEAEFTLAFPNAPPAEASIIFQAIEDAVKIEMAFATGTVVIAGIPLILPSTGVGAGTIS